MKYYLFNRPGMGKLQIPPVFAWKAADESSVAAQRIDGEYPAWTKSGIEFNLYLNGNKLKECSMIERDQA